MVANEAQKFVQLNTVADAELLRTWGSSVSTDVIHRNDGQPHKFWQVSRYAQDVIGEHATGR